MALVDGLLAQLKVRGLSIKWDCGDRLLLCGPKEEKTPDIIEAVKAYKMDLLRLYRPEPEPEQCGACNMIVYAIDEPTAVSSMCDKGKKCPHRTVKFKHQSTRDEIQ